MAITSLSTLPGSTTRLGGSTLRIPSATVTQMRFAAAAASNQGPHSVIAANDFLIFGQMGRVSGINACPFWSYQDASNQIGLLWISTGADLYAYWISGGVNRNTTVAVGTPTLPNVSYHGATFTWFWQRTGDQYRIGIVNGHDNSLVVSANVTDLAALGSGANWANLAAGHTFLINASSTSNYTAGMFGGANFIAYPAGGAAAAGLGTDANILAVLNNHQRIFDAGRTLSGIVSYGDIWRAGSRLNPKVATRIAVGDALVCPVTSRALTAQIGNNTEASSQPASVFPNYTLPTSLATVDPVGRDDQPIAPHYFPNTVKAGSAVLQTVTIVGPGGNIRVPYLTVCDAQGNRVQPPILVPRRWYYSKNTVGVYSKLTTRAMIAQGSSDNHHNTALVNVNNDYVLIHSCMHSEGFNSPGYQDIPASGDVLWSLVQLLNYRDPTSFSDDGFTVVDPFDSSITWTQAPSGTSTHQDATCSYTSLAVVRGTGSADLTVVSSTRHMDTSPGWNDAFWYNSTTGSGHKQLTTPTGSTLLGAISCASFDLGSGYFLLVMCPRFPGGGGFCGLIGFIGNVNLDMTNSSNWWSARTGEVLDGSGAHALSLPVQRGNFEVQFGYPANESASPITESRAAFTLELGMASDHIVYMIAVGAVASEMDLSYPIYQLLLKSHKFNPTTKALDLINQVDLYAEIDAVLGVDPNAAGAPEASRLESSSCIQPCASNGGFVLWIRSRQQTTLTQGTHYTDFAWRYGTRIIGMFFPDPSNLSRRAWLREANGTLFEAWNVTRDGGLSCGPLAMNADRSDSVPILVFYDVWATNIGATARPVVDASAAIARGMVRVAVPISQNANTRWTNGSGGTTNLHLLIDETLPSDVDFIRSDGTGTATIRFGMTSLIDPAQSTGHKLSTRWQLNSGSACSLTVNLKDGAGAGTTRATRVIIVNDPGFPHTDVWTLSAAEANAITDYTTLQIELVATSPAGETANVTWLQFEIVDPAAGQSVVPIIDRHYRSRRA